jgi:hypothetical protein
MTYNHINKELKNHKNLLNTTIIQYITNNKNHRTINNLAIKKLNTNKA